VDGRRDAQRSVVERPLHLGVVDAVVGTETRDPVGGGVRVEVVGKEHRDGRRFIIHDRADFDTTSLANSLYFTTKDGAEFDRRTIYRLNAVSGKDALLEAFDAPDPGIRTPDRRATTTPQQALVLLNDPFVLRQAAAFADRIKDKTNDDLADAVRRAYRRAIGREPTEAEAARAAAVARDHGLKAVCWALFNTSEFLHVR
jgi:hypothetical protein